MDKSLTIKHLIIFFVIQIAMMAIFVFFQSRWQSNRQLEVYKSILEIQEHTKDLVGEMGRIAGGLQQLDSLLMVEQIQYDQRLQAWQKIDNLHQQNRAKRSQRQAQIGTELTKVAKSLEALKQRSKQFKIE